MATLKTLFSGFAALSLIAGATLMPAPNGSTTAYAQASSNKATVVAAKARGEVGEQINGYLGIVEGASPSDVVKNAVREINIARKAVYTEAADGSGQPASVFATLTGEKQIKKAASGHFVRDASGAWKRK